MGRPASRPDPASADARGPLDEDRSPGSPHPIRALVNTYAYIVGQQGAVTVLNLGYWLFVTHFFAAAQAGVAFAAVAVATLLGALGSLGVATLLVAEIKSFPPDQRRTVISTGTAVASTVVAVLAALTLGLAPVFGRTVDTLAADAVTASLFVVGTVGTMAAVIYDRAAIGLRRGPAQLTRGIAAALARLALSAVLLAAGWRTGRALVFAWAVTLGLSCVLCAPLLRLVRAAPAWRGWRARAGLIRRYGPLSLNHHAVNLSLTAVSYFVPAVAAALLVAKQYAYFATAQTVAVTMLAPTYLLAVALFAEGSRDERQLGRLVRRSFPYGLAICAAIIAVAELGAPLVLRLFGDTYAAHGVVVLRLLALVGLPYVVKDHYVAIRRAQGRLGGAARVLALGTAAETVGVVIGGALGGVDGLCLGWVLVAAVEAVFLLPPVLRVQALGRPDAAVSSRRALAPTPRR